MTMKAVVVCPGRGSYNKTELGYLQRYFPDEGLMAQFDAQRAGLGQLTLSELDGAARFSLSTHTRGDNASVLIFAAALGDFRALDRTVVDVVAVTGNSMGWYSALACAGAVTPENGFRVANTMGALMQQASIGGQILYPFLDEDWSEPPGRRAELLAIVEEIAATGDRALSLSIDLGGTLVLAGDEPGLAAFDRAVEPVQQRYPMRLRNHSAFHTPLMQPVSEQGRRALPSALFGDPDVPMIDGRGSIWWPHTCDPVGLHAYTLGTQVVDTYDFTKAITVAAREFAPDVFIVLGPGTTMGGAVAQSLVLANWRGMTDKTSFRTAQNDAAMLISMGMPEQRLRVLPKSDRELATSSLT